MHVDYIVMHLYTYRLGNFFFSFPNINSRDRFIFVFQLRIIFLNQQFCFNNSPSNYGYCITTSNSTVVSQDHDL